MKSYRVLGSAVVVSLACLIGIAQADTIVNLVPNGDFTTDISGWSGGQWDSNAGSPDGPSASFTGHNWFCRSTMLTTPSLVEGQTYRASFLAALVHDDGIAADAILYAKAGVASGNYILTPTLDSTWRRYSVDFVATAADVGHAYEVTFLSGYGIEMGYAGATGGSRFGVDSVSLTAVPEPSAVTLLGAAVFGLLAYAWRKRR